jgi:hypothetical protein
LFKGIQIDHYQIDGLNVIGAGGRFMIFVSANKKQTAVNLWVQSFHPPIHHLGKASVGTQIRNVRPASRNALAVPPVEIN